jgi:FMN-dependent NADH-azoreductase
MTHILHIDSSPRAERSFSKTLSQEFITAWKAAYPEDTIAYRDLATYPVPHVDKAWIAAAFTPPEERTAEAVQSIEISDTLVDEFLSADRYILGVPMYNFNVPSTLKAYIDQIVRVNRTFTMEGKGLVEGKKMLIITARGYNYQEQWAPYDFQEPFLRTVFGFIGITDITFIHAEGLNLGEDFRADGLAKARTAIDELILNW